MSDDLALTDKQNISEHIDELADVASLFKVPVLTLIEEFDNEEVELSSKITGPTLGRAMYHLGYIIGFAVSRDYTVAELFDSLELP